MQWGCSHPYDPWNYTNIYGDWVPALWVSKASGYTSLTPQLSSKHKQPRHSPVLTTAEKSSWKSQREKSWLSTLANNGCGSLPPPLSRLRERALWAMGVQKSAQDPSSFFSQKNLSRGENFLQNMTLTGSNPKEISPAPYLSSGTSCGFLGWVACSSCWNGWGQDSAWQHLSLAGSIPTNSTRASHGLRMVWEWSLPGVIWQYRRSLLMLLGYDMSRPSAEVPGCHKSYPSCNT